MGRIHGVITRANITKKEAQSLIYGRIQERLNYYLHSLLSPGALLESLSNPLHTYSFIAHVLCWVKRWDKDRVATPPLCYLDVLSMWLQNGNLEGLGGIAFQIRWLLWGVAKEIHPQEKKKLGGVFKCPRGILRLNVCVQCSTPVVHSTIPIGHSTPVNSHSLFRP